MLHDTLPYITIVIVTTPDNGPRSSGVHARVWRADFEPAAIAALKFLPIGCFRSAHGALPLRAPINVMSICDRPASHEVFHLFQGICVARCPGTAAALLLAKVIQPQRGEQSKGRWRHSDCRPNDVGPRVDSDNIRQLVVDFLQ
jgi:hypothetical protein